MVRISKQAERRNVSPRKHRYKPNGCTTKTEKVEFTPKENAVEGDIAKKMYIPKIK